ncbi:MULTISPECIES: endonuclease III domain-containing protein [Sphingomonas]|uniref:endonuclease III domain-containing protein n=1 Tax=Sphingomonas TaxID=13687 RepID=UPI00254ED89A|nr:MULTISPECIES: endonuclease III [Sphingomonas]MDK8186989.1 endonuclease III [Sphingomonas zeae]MDK8216803.1 endonuclease III [Sphingomonas sp. UMB7805-LC452B]
MTESEADDAAKVARLTAIYDILSDTYSTYEESGDPWMTNGLSATPFRHLVSGCLSTMTVTSRLIRAAVPLYQRVSSFEELLALDNDTLRDIIRPVAHYNRKTLNLKAMCSQIIDEHGGTIPRTREAVMELKGVGRKVADLVMNHLNDQDSIAVDSHVLRVLRRLGMVGKVSPEAAADAIGQLTPPGYRRHAHEWLIQLGMMVCHARKPDCGACVVRALCPTGDS